MGRSAWSPPYKPLSGINIELRGDAGAIFFEDSGYRLFDANRKLVEKNKKGSHSWAEHLTNFIEAVRNGAKLNCTIEEGHKSTMLCHLGNIAYRTGQPLESIPPTVTSKTAPPPTNSGPANTEKAGSPASTARSDGATPDRIARSVDFPMFAMCSE